MYCHDVTLHTHATHFFTTVTFMLLPGPSGTLPPGIPADCAFDSQATLKCPSLRRRTGLPGLGRDPARSPARPDTHTHVPGLRGDVESCRPEEGPPPRPPPPPPRGLSPRPRTGEAAGPRGRRGAREPSELLAAATAAPRPVGGRAKRREPRVGRRWRPEKGRELGLHSQRGRSPCRSPRRRRRRYRTSLPGAAATEGGSAATTHGPVTSGAARRRHGSAAGQERNSAGPRGRDHACAVLLGWPTAPPLAQDSRVQAALAALWGPPGTPISRENGSPRELPAQPGESRGRKQLRAPDSCLPASCAVFSLVHLLRGFSVRDPIPYLPVPDHSSTLESRERHTPGPETHWQMCQRLKDKDAGSRRVCDSGTPETTHVAIRLI
ncbi:uncharacterized protein LOC143675702 [Tamandua tetradactyla]|uniref:uncharacterized protein LOC143675702 n=1 Tax=Tamandua tetradactyla TaxID=48850 RepID=UPI0040546FA2